MRLVPPPPATDDVDCAGPPTDRSPAAPDAPVDEHDALRRGVDTVTPIRARNVARCLRDLVARAEAGEIIGVAVAFETTDATAHLFALGVRSSGTLLVGELDVLKLSILIAEGRMRAPDER